MSPSRHVLQRVPAAALPTAVRGDGLTIETADGRRILDACGGAAVSCLGHSDRTVIDAVAAQLQTLAYAHTGFFTSEPAERLAALLCERAPAGLTRAFFVSGGSEAVESAIKLARQFHRERGEDRHRIIARRQSYHGNTLGALAAGGNMARRATYAPLLSDAMSHIEPVHAYRFAEPGESEANYARRAADALEAEILRLGPGSVAAFLAETVVGATMGAVPAPPDYFARVREICDRHGVLLILDEVMCGMGRTGRWFACEDVVAPDILIAAKGLGAGYQPIGAMLVSDTVHDAIAEGSGTLAHGFTYAGHPAACAAGVAVIEAIERGDLLANVRAMGERLRAGLVQRLGDHPNVGDIRGVGLLQALEFVADRASKAPHDPAAKTHAALKAAAFARDLMVYPMGGTIDGERGDHVVLAPAYIVSAAEIDTIVERFGAAVEDVLGAAGRAAA